MTPSDQLEEVKQVFGASTDFKKNEKVCVSDQDTTLGSRQTRFEALNMRLKLSKEALDSTIVPVDIRNEVNQSSDQSQVTMMPTPKMAIANVKRSRQNYSIT